MMESHGALVYISPIEAERDQFNPEAESDQGEFINVDVVYMEYNPDR